MLHKFFLICSFSAAIAFAAYSHAAEGVMTAQELASLFNGVTITHVSPRSGDPVTLNFQSGGVLDGKAGNRRDRGKWWIHKDGRICFQFPKLEKGQRHCHLLIRKGNHLVRLHKNGGQKVGEDWIIH